jgi:hypothetical protein
MDYLLGLRIDEFEIRFHHKRRSTPVGMGQYPYFQTTEYAFRSFATRTFAGAGQK